MSSPDDPSAEKSEEFLELANGCLCCSIKDAGIAAIEKLMKRKGAFDYTLSVNNSERGLLLDPNSTDLFAHFVVKADGLENAK